MIIGFKIILVRQYDEQKDEIFYGIYQAGRRDEFKEKQILSSAYAKKLDGDDYKAVQQSKESLSIGDIVYVNQMGWMEVIK